MSTNSDTPPTPPLPPPLLLLPPPRTLQEEAPCQEGELIFHRVTNTFVPFKVDLLIGIFSTFSYTFRPVLTILLVIPGVS